MNPEIQIAALSEIVKTLSTQGAETTKHIEILNREMGGVLANIETIKWFIGINVIAWLGAVSSFVWKRISKN